MRAFVSCGFLVLSILLPAWTPGLAEEPPAADEERFDELVDALGPSLASTQAEQRVKALRQLLLETKAVVAFPNLLGLARAHGGEGIGRAALEGLSRLAAPRMAAKLDGLGLSSGGPDETGDELLRFFVGHPLRVLPSVAKRLEDVVRGSGRFNFEDGFVGLSSVTERLDVAFVFDVVKREVAIMTPEEAVAFHAAWMKDSGREMLTWFDFLGEQQGVVHDALDPGGIDVRLAQLLGGSPDASRRAAYVLGRCLAAGDALRSAEETATDRQRAVIEAILARHELRRYGEVVLVSRRGGTGDLWRMRLDGGGLQRLTSEGDAVYGAAPSPDGRFLAYLHDRGEAFGLLAVLDLETGTVWRAGDVAVSAKRWSPGGRFLTYLAGPRTSSSLRMLDAETGAVTKLGAVRRPRLGRWSLPSWSPDGTAMVYAVEGSLVVRDRPDGDARRVAAGVYRAPEWLGEDILVIRNVDGRDTLVRRTANGAETPYPRPDGEAVRRATVSPDGAWAVLEMVRADPKDRRPPGIHLLSLGDETVIRKVGEGMFGYPLWSPTSEKVALDGSYRVLSVLDLEGKDLGEPKPGASAGAAVWGPKGEILYAAEMLPLAQDVTQDRLKHEGRLLRWRDGAWDTMRDLEGWFGLQRVTPDGRWLFLSSDEAGDREMIAASTDGTHWLNLTEHPVDDLGAVPLPSRVGPERGR